MAISMTWPQYRRKECWYNRRPVKLSYMQAELLSVLLMHRGRILSRDELMDMLYPSVNKPSPLMLSQHLGALRARVPGTVRSVGYRGYTIERGPHHG
jgi:DNA-binding response OmpR family regulator